MHQYVLLTLRIRLLLRLLRCYWHRDCLLRPWLLHRVQSISRTWLVFKCRKPRGLGPVSVRAVCEALRMARGLSLSRFALRAAGWYLARCVGRGCVRCFVLGTRYAVRGTQLRAQGPVTSSTRTPPRCPSGNDSHRPALSQRAYSVLRSRPCLRSGQGLRGSVPEAREAMTSRG